MSIIEIDITKLREEQNTREDLIKLPEGLSTIKLTKQATKLADREEIRKEHESLTNVFYNLMKKHRLDEGGKGFKSTITLDLTEYTATVDILEDTIRSFCFSIKGNEKYSQLFSNIILRKEQVKNLKDFLESPYLYRNYDYNKIIEDVESKNNPLVFAHEYAKSLIDRKISEIYKFYEDDPEISQYNCDMMLSPSQIFIYQAYSHTYTCSLMPFMKNVWESEEYKAMKENDAYYLLGDDYPETGISQIAAIMGSSDAFADEN